MPEKTGIVLMPGIDGTGAFFGPLLHALPRGIPVSVITYPGNTILSLEGHARYVAERFPADNVVLVAESFSGLVGLELLHLGPPEVKGIVFSAAFAGPLHRRLIRTLSFVPGIGPIVKKLPVSLIGHFLFGPFFDKNLEALLRRSLPLIDAKCLKHRAGIVADGYPLLNDRFDVPCLYLQPTGDRVVPSAAASWFAAHFGHFERERFDAPHCLLQTRPEECSEKIMDFIERRILLT